MPPEADPEPMRTRDSALELGRELDPTPDPELLAVPLPVPETEPMVLDALLGPTSAARFSEKQHQNQVSET